MLPRPAGGRHQKMDKDGMFEWEACWRRGRAGVGGEAMSHFSYNGS